MQKVIEVTRVNLFNIITQYRAIFNDEAQSPIEILKTDHVNQNVMFFSWISEKVSNVNQTFIHINYFQCAKYIYYECISY